MQKPSTHQERVNHLRNLFESNKGYYREILNALRKMDFISFITSQYPEMLTEDDKLIILSFSTRYIDRLGYISDEMVEHCISILINDNGSALSKKYEAHGFCNYIKNHRSEEYERIVKKLKLFNAIEHNG